MGQVNPGKYSGFEVVALSNGRTKITAGKESTVFNAAGRVSRDQSDEVEVMEPETSTPPPKDPDEEKKSPAGEKSWTEGLRTR